MFTSENEKILSRAIARQLEIISELQLGDLTQPESTHQLMEHSQILFNLTSVLLIMIENTPTTKSGGSDGYHRWEDTRDSDYRQAVIDSVNRERW